MGSRSDEVDNIRRDIDATRERLGESVGALAYRADVKQRGKEAIDDKKEVVMEKVDELKSKLSGDGETEGGLTEKVKDRLPSADGLKAKLPDGQALKDKLPDGAHEAAGRIGDATPSKEDVKAKAHDAADAARENPAAVAGAAAVAGLAAGLALPETEIEREKVKPVAQEARAEITGRVQETVQQVKEGAQDAAGSVADAVKEQAQQQGGKVGEMAEKAADTTQDRVGRS